MRFWVISTLVICSIGCNSLPISSLKTDSSTSRRFDRVLTNENPIPAENQNPGNPEWSDGWRADNRELEVYLSRDSSQAGDYVSVKVSSDRDSSVTAEVYRLGYYGGAGARRLWSGGPYSVSRQQTCPLLPTTGRIECAWSETFFFQIGADWVSGVYLVKVKRPDFEPFKRYATFVVRDGRAAEVLLKPAFTTYQAYNNYGGESLYQDDSGLVARRAANEVSFDRPFVDGEGAGFLFYSEYPFLLLLEKNGYDVTYATNLDYLRFPNLLNGIGALVIAAHDEYWSVEERSQVDAALASGQTSLNHYSANGAYWRVRFSDDLSGNALRTMICYKGDSADPIPDSTTRFRDGPSPNSETHLFGVGYDGFQYLNFPLAVRNSGHWLYQGTGVGDGEQMPGLVGVEFDRLWPELGTPPDVNVIEESPVVTADGFPNRAHMVERTLSSGNTVFSAGGISWTDGINLNRPLTRDDRIVRMALNAIERALAHRRPPVEPPAPGPIRPTPPTIVGDWVATVAPLAGSAGSGGWIDGPGDSARFSRPSGIASTASGQVVVADAANSVIRLVDADADRTVRTVAGTGFPGSADGVPGAQAMFNKPSGVAVGSDGTIYVVDTENQVVRRIANDPPTYTVTTYAGGMGQAGYTDSTDPLQSRFNWPVGLAIDGQNNLYVSEIRGGRIRKIDGETREVTTYGVDPETFGTFYFSSPSAVAVGPTGAVYVLEGYAQNIRRISPSGVHFVDTVARDADSGVGYVDGAGSQARFRAQLGMVVNAAGAIFLADTANYRIRKIVPGDTPGATFVSTIAGSGRVGTRLGSGDVADIVAPSGLAITPDQRLIVSDSFNDVLRQIPLSTNASN